jgi:hypothetical protein
LKPNDTIDAAETIEQDDHMSEQSQPKVAMAELAEIELQDRERVIKYLRYTALSLDQVCGNLVELTRRLEEAHLIPGDRKTRKKRDAQLKHRKSELVPSAAFVNDMLEKVRDQADPEALVASLFRDLDLPLVKKMAESSKPKPDPE